MNTVHKYMDLSLYLQLIEDVRAVKNDMMRQRKAQEFLDKHKAKMSNFDQVRVKSQEFASGLKVEEKPPVEGVPEIPAA